LLGETFEPLTAVSAPPLGAGVATGIRQTTVPLHPGSALWLFSDGLVEARVGDRRLERGGLQEMASALGRGLTAPVLLERVAATATEIGDDMACACSAPPPPPHHRRRSAQPAASRSSRFPQPSSPPQRCSASYGRAGSTRMRRCR